MRVRRFSKSLWMAGFASLGALSPFQAAATSLSIGADSYVRGVSVKSHDLNFPSNKYYTQRLQAYMIADLTQDVEATLRVQSINPWGLEGSTTPLVTRYPNANGTPWIQNAFIRLPNIWRNNATVTVGRQPIQWNDGQILSDDELGFNAIRAQFNSPWRALPFDVDGFTAKISESLTQDTDTDLHGALLGFDYKYARWDFMGLFESRRGTQNYNVGSSTTPFSASKVDRQIFGVFGRANLVDAYVKGAFYFQNGDVKRSGGGQDVSLSGTAYMIGLGGKTTTRRIGRFGALLEYAVGDGDESSSADEDEAFRAPFGSRWAGLERRGYGRYFAATFSDVYSSTSPFAPVGTNNTGLPAGMSGVQSTRFGLEATPFANWTFTFEYLQYKAQERIVGEKELGKEFDYGFIYRYSGLVTVRGSINKFTPGKAFPPEVRQDADRSEIEIEIKF